MHTTSDAWLLAIFSTIDNPAEIAATQRTPPAPQQPVQKSNPCACGRCGGTGVINEFRRVNGGTCFGCQGTGYSSK
jgi:hypothetical protein